MSTTIRMDIMTGRFFRDVRIVTDSKTSITCKTKGCFRNGKSYDREIRGSLHCDNCNSIMRAVKEHRTEKVFVPFALVPEEIR